MRRRGESDHRRRIATSLPETLVDGRNKSCSLNGIIATIAMFTSPRVHSGGGGICRQYRYRDGPDLAHPQSC